MTTQKLPVNYYTLRSASIFPETATLGISSAAEKQIDITGMIPSFLFTESIEDDMLSGHLDVVDSVGFLEKYPMRGEERLTVEVEDAMKNVRVWDLFVYQIDTLTVNSVSKVSSYKLHFTTYQSFLALNRLVTRGFRQKTITQIARELFDELYRPSTAAFSTVTLPQNTLGKNFVATKKDLVTEDTDGFVRVAIPRMTTPEAMNFLERRAYSQRSPSSSFNFFESSDAFYFVSDEWLFSRAKSKDPLIFTFADGFKKDGSQFFSEMANFESLTNHKRVNTLDDLYDGAYRNRVLELDVVRRFVNLNDLGYNYFDFRKRYFNNVNADRHSPEFINFYSRPDNAKSFLIVKDFSDDEDVADFQLKGQTHFRDIVQNRLPYTKHLNSISLSAVGPPRLDITIGDVITLNIDEVSADTSKIENNAQLSGEYLVKGLTRAFRHEEGRNHYTLVKMNWAGERTTVNIDPLKSIRKLEDTVRGYLA